MIKAPSNIKNPVATTRGWVDENGELLKSQKLTQAQCDEFNGVTNGMASLSGAPSVEPKVEEAPKPAKKTTKKKKKTTKKKKKTAKQGFFSKLMGK